MPAFSSSSSSRFSDPSPSSAAPPQGSAATAQGSPSAASPRDRSGSAVSTPTMTQQSQQPQRKLQKVEPATPALVRKYLEHRRALCNLRSRLARCFLEVNPIKIAEIDDLLAKLNSIGANEVFLFSRLNVKYQEANSAFLRQQLHFSICAQEVISWVASFFPDMERYKILETARTAPAILDVLRDGMLLCRIAKLQVRQIPASATSRFNSTGDVSSPESSPRDFEDAVDNTSPLGRYYFDANDNVNRFVYFCNEKLDWQGLSGHQQVLFEAADLVDARNDEIVVHRLLWVALRMYMEGLSDVAPPLTAIYEYGSFFSGNMLQLREVFPAPDPSVHIALLHSALVGSHPEVRTTVTFDAPSSTISLSHPIEHPGPLEMPVCVLQGCLVVRHGSLWQLLGQVVQHFVKRWDNIMWRFPLVDVDRCAVTNLQGDHHTSLGGGGTACGSNSVNGTSSFVGGSGGGGLGLLSQPSSAIRGGGGSSVPLRSVGHVQPATQASEPPLLPPAHLRPPLPPPMAPLDQPKSPLRGVPTTLPQLQQPSSGTSAHLRPPPPRSPDVTLSANSSFAPTTTSATRRMLVSTSLITDRQDSDHVTLSRQSTGYDHVPTVDVSDATTTATGSHEGSPLLREASNGALESFASFLASDVSCSREGTEFFDIDFSESMVVRVAPNAHGSLIGRGSYGSVFVGMQLDTGRSVAVKVIPLAVDHHSRHQATRVEAAEREVAMLSSFRHPNIVTSLGAVCITKGKTLCIAMEHASGGTLMSVVERFAPIPSALAHRYIRQMGAGIAYLHSNGVIHRDLKIANVLLRGDGSVAIADFGCSKSVSAVALGSRLVGTARYLARECLVREEYSEKSDVYAFGLCVVEMCLAAPPWFESDIVEDLPLMWHIANSGKQPFSDEHLSYLEPPIRSLVEWCLKPNPEDRPTMTQALEKFDRDTL